MTRPLRVALTADPYIPVPPRFYGGIERIVDLLVRGLVARGHEVTLIAHPESTTPAEIVGYGVPPHRGILPRGAELAQVGRALWRRRGAVDVVHSFGRLGGMLPLLPLRRVPKIQSYQRDRVAWRNVRAAVRLGGDSVSFVGCSESVFRARPDGSGRWRCIFNGVEIERYAFVERVAADAPLVFLGRLERIKGAHHAVAIARAAGRRLVIAGNRVDADDGYFARELAPALDGVSVRYIGPVDDAAKSALLGGAAALLMPIDVDEGFGIVMAEALACGTPVIAFARGSVPEVIRDGANGFVCRTVDEAAARVPALAAIDRRRVRADCEARFSSRVIVDQYEALYREAMERCGAS